MSYRITTFLCLSLTLYACSTHPPTQDKRQQAQMTGEYDATDDRVIAFPLKALRHQHPLHYVIFRKDAQRGWQIVSIDGPRLKVGKGKGKGQEELIISGDFRYISPNYKNLNIHHSGKMFSCNKGHMDEHHLRLAYNGCNSHLVKGGSMIESLFGKTFVVEFDPDKARALIETTGVLDEIPKCVAMRKEAETFRGKIEATFPVTDLSGFYNGEPLASQQVDYKYADLKCPGKLGNAKYSLQIMGVDAPFETDFEPKRITLAHNSVGHTIEIPVTVHAKRFNEIKVNDTYQDDNISVYLERVSHESNQVVFHYTLRNLSKRHIDVSAISFYVGDTVHTESQAIPSKLPPNAVTEQRRMFVRDNASLRGREMRRLITPVLTRQEAESRHLQLGVSVQYKIGNVTETLYSEKNYPYMKLL